MLKKILVLLLVGGGAWFAYSKFNGAKDERDLWTEATAAPDLR